MKLPKNTVFEWLDDQPEPHLARVLDYLPNGSIVTIKLNDPKALPEVENEAEITQALEDKRIRVLETDPFSAKNIPEGEISERNKGIRDENWELIQPIITKDPEIVFSRKGRWKAITSQEKQTGKTPKTIYRSLHKYWTGGQIKNALLPDYRYVGGKLGNRNGRKGDGLKLDPEHIKKFELGIKAFYEKDNKPSLREAYHKTLSRHFNAGYNMVNGNPVPQLPPAHLLPTERQFRYWFKNYRNPEKSLLAREGKRYNLKHRALDGNANAMSFGPGSLYQIDATVGDIYLVSTLNRATIVGRPTLYLVTDVFTRCIAGFVITLENPSYQQACLALENSIRNKVEFCNEFGITISEEEWPCQGIPETLVADRGELKGGIADPISSALGIRLDNCPPYRADMKGVVERFFRLGNQRLFHQLPGAVKKSKERGDKDPRLEARLDIIQLTKLTIGWILDHNHRHLDHYPAEIFHIQEGIDLTPCSLWEWGTKKKTGAMPLMAPEVVRTHLLPSAQAGITPKGIHFQKAYYTCERAIAEQWFVRARETRGWKIKVHYDPRDVNILYARIGNSTEKCRLKEVSEKFAAKTWAEVQAYFYEQRQQEAANKGQALQNEATYQAQIADVVLDAKNAFTTPTGPKSARVGKINTNRKEEAERLKDKTAEPTIPEVEPTYIGPPSHIALLRKQKEEDK